MTNQEIDTELVKEAIDHVSFMLTAKQRTDPDYIHKELTFVISFYFNNSNRRLNTLQVYEISDLEFEVKANGHASGTLLIKTNNP